FLIIHHHPSTFSHSTLVYIVIPPPPTSTLFPYTTLFRSAWESLHGRELATLTAEFDGGSGPEPHTIDRLLSYIHHRDRELRLARSEEHTSELQSPDHLVCRLLLEKKKTNNTRL